MTARARPGAGPELVARSSTVVYRNPWMTVREDQTERRDGTPGIYGVVDKPDFALVVPYTDDGFHLVQQFRYPAGGRFWEFPQGSHQDARPIRPAQLARDELAEETGLVAAQLTELGCLYEAYGYSSQRFHVFLATRLVQREARPEPEEADLVCRWFATDEVWSMISGGQIRDAPTVAALALLSRHLPKLPPDR